MNYPDYFQACRDFAKQIKPARTHTRMTQAALADAASDQLGWTMRVGTIGRIERMEQDPLPEDIAAIGNVLKIPFAQVIQQSFTDEVAALRVTKADLEGQTPSARIDRLALQLALRDVTTQITMYETSIE